MDNWQWLAIIQRTSGENLIKFSNHYYCSLWILSALIELCVCVSCCRYLTNSVLAPFISLAWIHFSCLVIHCIFTVFSVSNLQTFGHPLVGLAQLQTTHYNTSQQIAGHTRHPNLFSLGPSGHELTQTNKHTHTHRHRHTVSKSPRERLRENCIEAIAQYRTYF